MLQLDVAIQLYLVDLFLKMCVNSILKTDKAQGLIKEQGKSFFVKPKNTLGALR